MSSVAIGAFRRGKIDHHVDLFHGRQCSGAPTGTPMGPMRGRWTLAGILGRASDESCGYSSGQAE